jgi:hypothetical protein
LSVLLAGFVAGTLDGLAASVRYFLETGRGPAGVFKFIASGVFGRSAFAGGSDMVLAGVAFHYCIALGWALLYGLLTLQWKGLRSSRYLAGLGWALVVWCAMTFVVLPLSRTPRIPLTPRGATIAILILMLCVGVPISWILSRFHRRAARQMMVGSSLLALLMLGTAGPLRAANPEGTASPAKAVPVILELYTSEGCSSCPPADDNLKRLASDPPPGVRVIPMAFHVDYWDSRGWRDRWSKHDWTARQLTYMRRFNRPSPYTPQMIVDGRFEFLGHAEALAREKILEASASQKQLLDLAQAGRTVRIQGEGPTTPAVLTAFMLQEQAESNVLQGENQGRRLSHTAIVLSMETFGLIPAGKPWERTLKLPKHLEGTRVVAVLQEPSLGQIVGAGDLPVAQDSGL